MIPSINVIVQLGLLIFNYQNISHLIRYYHKNTIVFCPSLQKNQLKNVIVLLGLLIVKLTVIFIHGFFGMLLI